MISLAGKNPAVFFKERFSAPLILIAIFLASKTGNKCPKNITITTLSVL